MDEFIKLCSTDWNILKSKEKDDRTLHFIASKEIVDRDFEIVKINGLSINNFKKNPVILLNHNSSGLPIGKATNIWKKSDELHVKVQFASFEEYDLADTVYELVKNGYLKSLSIRFLPDYNKIEYTDPSKDRNGTRRIFHKADLLEISVVTIPANTAALLQSKSKMIEDKILSEDEFNKFIELCDEKEEQNIKDEITDNETDMSGDEVIFSKPYPDEHACRLQEPDPKALRYRRKNCDEKINGKCVDVIWMIVKKDGKEIPIKQSMRFKTKTWKEAAAKAACKDKGGRFEAAKKSVEEQLEEIKEELATVTKTLSDILKSKEQEETNYFDDLFEYQDDGVEPPNQSNDDSTDGKGMFQFLDEGTVEK